MNRVKLVHQKLNSKLLVMILLSVLMSYSSCQHDEVYYQYRELKDQKWAKNDTLFFDIDSNMVKPNTPYHISMELANNANYPYKNIWFFIQDNINDEHAYSYSKEYMLADDFGRWYGSGFGSLYQLSLEYEKVVYFKSNRNYRIKIVQGMRDEPLVGIERFGLRIEEIKPKMQNQ